MSLRKMLLCALCPLWLVFLLAAAPPTTGPSSREIEALIGQLSSPDEKVRQAAQDKLISMGDEARTALEAYVRARSAAEAALQKIDTNKVAGATLLSLDVKGATPENLIAEISKQTGFDIRAYHESVWQQATPTPVTLKVDQQPFWTVMREACSKSGLAIYQGGYADRRMRVMAASQMGQNPMKCPAVISGAFMITVNSLQRTNSVDMANPQNISRSMYLNMMTFCEPKVRIVQYSYVPEIEQAVDDKGNSLVSTMRGGGPSRQMTSSRGVAWQCNVPLLCPAEVGQKIAKLSGKMRFVVQTRSETLEIPDVPKAKDVTKTVGGHRVTLKEFRKLGERQYQLTLIMYRDGMEQQQFYEMVNNPNIRLSDADGHDFVFNGANSGRNTNDSYEARLMFGMRGEPGEAALGEPATLSWEIPTAVQEITIPFEFSDLPLP